MTRSHDRWIDTLEQTPLIARSSRSERRLVVAVTTPLVRPPGTVLARQGARPSAFVILLDGTAEARRDGRRVEAISPGTHFGEIALVRGIGEPATVIAQTQVSIGVVGPREFRNLYAVLDGFRDGIDRELDRRVPTWLTPRSTVRAVTAPPARSVTTAARRLPRIRPAEPRPDVERHRHSVAICVRRWRSR